MSTPPLKGVCWIFQGGSVFISGIYFALIGAKKYAALSHQAFCRIPERTDSFWPNKVSFFAYFVKHVAHVQFAEKIGTLHKNHDDDDDHHHG